MTLSPDRRQSIAWIALALLGLAAVKLLAPVLTPFLIAAVLAYALHPPVEWLAARRVPRVLAVAMIEVAAIAALLALVLLVVPIISKELPLLQEQIPRLAERLNQVLSPWLAQFGFPEGLDVASIKAFVLKYLNANVEDLTAALLSSARIGGSILLAIVGLIILVPVALFYLLMDWPSLVQRAKHLIPPHSRPRIEGFMAECDATLGQYLRGQLLVMVILAVYYSVALGIAGFDLALPVGVFTGLAIFIPYVGFAVGLVLALTAGALQFDGAYGLITVVVVYGIGQVGEGFFLTPRLVGERIGMNPLMVIFALLAFGHLFGFVGVLIALPLSSLVVVAVRRARAMYLASPLYRR
ncbi:MAG: AI-2E family transporter [Burkholderiaceae bacterium]